MKSEAFTIFFNILIIERTIVAINCRVFHFVILLYVKCALSIHFMCHELDTFNQYSPCVKSSLLYILIRIVRLRLSYVSSLSSIYRRIKSGVGREWMGSMMEDLSRRSQERDPLLVRGCVLRRAKITSSLSISISLGWE